MTQSQDDFWKGQEVNRDKQSSQIDQDREATAAEGMIKFVLSESGYGAAYGWAALANECKLLTGSPTLTFDWFHERYPSFPVKLGAMPIPFVHHITMRELFDGFLKSRVFKAYKEFIVQGSHDDTQTLVAFGFKEVRRRMVLHNYPRTYDIEQAQEAHNQGTRIVHQFGEVTYTIEPLKNFIGAIGCRWLQDAE